MGFAKWKPGRKPERSLRGIGTYRLMPLFFACRHCDKTDDDLVRAAPETGGLSVAKLHTTAYLFEIIDSHGLAQALLDET
jgi:hypothetical protein